MAITIFLEILSGNDFIPGISPSITQYEVYVADYLEPTDSPDLPLLPERHAGIHGYTL